MINEKIFTKIVDGLLMESLEIIDVNAPLPLPGLAREAKFHPTCAIRTWGTLIWGLSRAEIRVHPDGLLYSLSPSEYHRKKFQAVYITGEHFGESVDDRDFTDSRFYAALEANNLITWIGHKAAELGQADEWARIRPADYEDWILWINRFYAGLERQKIIFRLVEASPHMGTLGKWTGPELDMQFINSLAARNGIRHEYQT